MPRLNHTWNVVFCLCVCVCGSAQVWSVDAPQTTFNTGVYQNNQQLGQVLEIPGAEALEVTVSGKSEKKYDWLRIYFNDKQQHKEFSGEVNETFMVPGSRITVTFNSDGRTTDKGFTVNIRAASPTSTFAEIRRDLHAIINDIATNGAQYAKQEIVNNIGKFHELQTKINQNANPNSDAFIQQVTEVLLSVAQSYALISSMSEGIHEHNLRAFKKLEELLVKTRESQNALSNRKASEINQLEILRKRVANPDTPLAEQKDRVSLNGAESIISSLQVQEDTWQKFYQTQIKLLDHLRTHDHEIELLLHVLNVNSTVYREAAYAIQLKRGMGLALQTFDENLSNLREVLNQIEANWTAIRGLIAEIDQVRFK